MKNTFIIATVKSWNIIEAKKFIKKYSNKKVYVISNNEDLTHEKVQMINPRFIFFPHWSWKVPKKIYENFECIIFHMTDLPYGRGGSPLQNLIVRGKTKTKISALKACDTLDAGAIYLKKELSLEGSATEIFERTSKIIFTEMIPYIIKNEPKPVPQKGDIVRFERRKPEESSIMNIDDLEKIYDSIRMLDAEEYPLAFVETPKYKIEFSDAKLNKGVLTAKAIIKLKKDLKK